MNRFTIELRPGWRRGRRRYCGAVIALAVGLGAMSSTAFASTDVSGSADSVTVDAQNSSIKDVLSALGQKFHLQVQSTANLDKQISGSYRGSLRGVVTRLLEGYNFVITSSQGELEITVLGTENQQNITGAPGQGSAIIAMSPHAAKPPTRAAAASADDATSIPATTQAPHTSSKPAPRHPVRLYRCLNSKSQTVRRQRLVRRRPADQYRSRQQARCLSPGRRAAGRMPYLIRLQLMTLSYRCRPEAAPSRE